MARENKKYERLVTALAPITGGKRAARSALLALEKGGVPITALIGGKHVVVPTKPSEAQVAAGLGAIRSYSNSQGERRAMVYEAMLRATSVKDVGAGRDVGEKVAAAHGT